METENKLKTTERERETVKITIYTDWKCDVGDKAEFAKLRIEKSCQMASALFHLIEISCMPYEQLTLSEADSEFAQNHIELIRAVAELGKQLAYQI